MLIIDAEDESGNIHICLSDRDCRTILGMDASEFGEDVS